MEPGDFITKGPVGQAGIDVSSAAASSAKSTDKIPRILAELKQQMALSRQASTKTERENATFLADKFNSILDSNLRSSLSQWATMSPTDPKRDTFYNNILKAVSERTEAVRSDKTGSDTVTGKISSFFDEYKKVKAKPSTILTGEATPAAGYAYIVVELLKKLIPYAQATALEVIDSFQSIQMAGGQLTDRLETATTLTGLLKDTYIDASESLKGLIVFQKNYGVALSDALNSQGQFDLTKSNASLAAAAEQMPNLILLGRTFGLTTEQVTSNTAKLKASFHTDVEDSINVFHRLAEAHLATGIDAEELNSTVIRLGEGLRYSGSNADSFLTVVDSVEDFVNTMTKLSKGGSKEWKGMGTGEFTALSQKAVDLGANVSPTQFLAALQYGSKKPIGLAEGLDKYYALSDLERSKVLVKGLMAAVPTTEGGKTLTQEQRTREAASFMTGLQGMGRMGPKEIQALLATGESRAVNYNTIAEAVGKHADGRYKPGEALDLAQNRVAVHETIKSIGRGINQVVYNTSFLGPGRSTGKSNALPGLEGANTLTNMIGKAAKVMLGKKNTK